MDIDGRANEAPPVRADLAEIGRAGRRPSERRGPDFTYARTRAMTQTRRTA